MWYGYSLFKTTIGTFLRYSSRKTQRSREGKFTTGVSIQRKPFRADPQTICLVRTLKETHGTFFVLDTNNNPVEIKDADGFLKQLIARNQEALNAYHQLYETFTRKGD